MTIHLQQFVDRVRGHEARGAKDFVMSMSDAKNLHADITSLMLRLHNLQEAAVNTQAPEVITVQINGAPF
jgi:DNA primase